MKTCALPECNVGFVQKNKGGCPQLFCSKRCRRRAERRRQTAREGSPNKHRELKRDLIRRVKREAGCAHCPERDVRCLEFHHVDPSTKSFALGAKTHRSMARILAEIEKCIVLCANCHRKLERPAE